MKKVLVLALAVMLLLSAAVPAMATAKPLEGGFIPVIPLGVAHQFWQAVKMGAEQAAEEYGVTIVFDGPQEETMVDKQVDILRANLTNENLIAVCMAAIDEQSVLTDLTAVKEKGMPVVGFDAGCGAIADAHCSTSNYAAGELAAQNAIRLLNGEGKIAIVGHSAQKTGRVLDLGHLKCIDTWCYGDGWLTALDIETGKVACVGAYNGLKEINMIGKVMLIGFDSSAAMKAGVRNGEIAGAITQDPVGMGYKAVATACKLVLGEPVEGEVNENGTIVVDTGCYWYDATNMDEAHIAPLLYD